MRPRTALAPGVLILAACAGMPVAPPRLLASETYVIREGGAQVGEEELKLETGHDFGWRLTGFVRRNDKGGRESRFAYDLAPDWSVRELVLTSTASPASHREQVNVDPVSGSLRVALGTESETQFATEPVSAGPLLDGCAAAALALVRARNLEPGGRASLSALHLDPFEGGMNLANVELERSADRGKRMVHRYRFEGGPWIEVETDYRGLPLVWRSGATTHEKR